MIINGVIRNILQRLTRRSSSSNIIMFHSVGVTLVFLCLPHT